jgi:dephospho-CoA kinase
VAAILKVGITGGIGSGKSTICKIFATLGVPILDADALAKHIIATDLIVREAVCKAFGEDVFANGILQKQILAARAFASEADTQLLNSIVHPAVEKHSLDWFAKQASHHYAIKEAAILIESGAYKHVDVVIGVNCAADIRVQRVLSRNPQLSVAQIQQRISKQISDEERQAYCHFNIINDGSAALIPQVLALHSTLSNYEKNEH